MGTHLAIISTETMEHDPNSHDDRSLGLLLSDEAGVAFTEYIILASVVTGLGAASIYTLGVPMVRLYEWGAALAIVPLP